MPIKKSKTPKLALSKISLTTASFFAVYLILLPLILDKIIPCLANHPFVSYTDQRCNVGLALNWYLTLALGGFVMFTITYWVILNRYFFSLARRPLSRLTFYHKWFPRFNPIFIFVAVTSLIMAVSIIAAFHLYIPTAETAVSHAPILLESMK